VARGKKGIEERGRKGRAQWRRIDGMERDSGGTREREEGERERGKGWDGVREWMDGKEEKVGLERVRGGRRKRRRKEM
jgi:hypothetical protein